MRSFSAFCSAPATAIDAIADAVMKSGSRSHAAEANQEFAKNLKGRLMLAHGTMDTNVPPYQTLLVADALIKANKDFDLVLLPNQDHGYGSASAYMMRRRWDFFVKWLMGAEPPREYRMQSPAAPAPPPAREPTRAQILRGAYGPYRANNDLLSYDLDVRVDPERTSVAVTRTPLSVSSIFSARQ